MAAKRGRAIYKAKGYPDDWIEKRMRGIAIRDQLTNEWEKQGVQEEKQYAILTAEIADATFGLKPAEHKKLTAIFIKPKSDDSPIYQRLLFCNVFRNIPSSLFS